MTPYELRALMATTIEAALIAKDNLTSHDYARNAIQMTNELLCAIGEEEESREVDVDGPAQGVTCPIEWPCEVSRERVLVVGSGEKFFEYAGLGPDDKRVVKCLLRITEGDHA